jgi:streptogramin lyase
LWVLDRGEGIVTFLPEGQPPMVSVASGLIDPVDLVIDGRGGCWVADRAGRILRLDPRSGVDLEVSLDLAPSGVTADPTRGEIWVASSRSAALRLLDDEGNELFRWRGNGGPTKVEGAWAPCEP